MSAFIDQHTAALADFFIKGLESGKGPIRRKWDAGSIPGYAHNFITGQPYHGGNQWSLLWALDQLAERGVDVSDTRFGTYKQAKSVGAQIRKGEQAFVGVKYVELNGAKKVDEAETVDPENSARPRLVAVPFFVFLASQIDGLPPMKKLEQRDLDERIREAQKIVDELGVPISHGGDRAYYSPSRDQIQIPERQAFSSDGDYMSVLLHECAHSTGHPSRLNRKFGERFGDPGYALEELRAEMASFDICRRTGVPFDPSGHVQSVNHWIEALRNDPRDIMRAAQDVEKILAYLKVPEIAYEKVPVIEQAKKQSTELPDLTASQDRRRPRSRSKGQAIELTL